jgi:transcriptional regulator with XRE-family HTH domain
VTSGGTISRRSGEQVRAEHMRREAGKLAHVRDVLDRHAADLTLPVGDRASNQAQTLGQDAGLTARSSYGSSQTIGRGGVHRHDAGIVHHPCTDLQGLSCTDLNVPLVHHRRTMQQLILAESDYRAAVGQRLRQLIRALGIKYTEAAEDMGIERNHLGNWMDGRAYPRAYELYKFCRIRGVNTDWIYLGDPSGLPARVVRELLQQAQAPEAQRGRAHQGAEN